MDIHFNALEKNFQGAPALGPLSAAFEGVNAFGIIGPSGGGKSTLIRLMAGLIPPSGGSLRVEGLPGGEMTIGADSKPEELLNYRKRLGVVFQNYNLFPHLSALENITLPLRHVHGLSKQSAKDRALSYLSSFRLEEFSGRKPRQLSGGQQQRVAIVRAMASEPELLFLDEPTSALDPESTVDVLRMIFQMRDRGQKIIFSTHHMPFALRASDRLLLLKNGRLEASMNPSEEDPRHLPQAFEEFIHQNFL